MVLTELDGFATEMTEATETRLAELGIALPEPPAAVSDYEPFSRVGSLIITSGQLPLVAGRLQSVGMIGRELTFEDGRRACRAATLNAIAQIRSAATTLDNVRIVRVEGVLHMEASEGAPHVLDGASELINSVFVERGRHSRMIHLAQSVALDAPCLIVLWAEMLGGIGSP
ncbi:MAG: Atu1372/SO_1960 family protein [Mesorhizobium sp.]